MPAKIIRTPCELVYHSIPPGTYTVKIWGAGGGGSQGDSQGDKFAYGGGGAYQEFTFTSTSFKIATTYVGSGGTQGNLKYQGIGGCGADTAGNGGTFETYSGGGGGGSSWFSLGGSSTAPGEIRFVSAGGGGAGANGNQSLPAATGGNSIITSTGGVGGYFNGRPANNFPNSSSGGGGGGGILASGGGGGRNLAPSSTDIVAQNFSSFSYLMTLTTVGNSGLSGGSIFSGNIGLPGNYSDNDRGETLILLKDDVSYSVRNIKNVKIIGGTKAAKIWIENTTENIHCDKNVDHLILDEEITNLKFLQKDDVLYIESNRSIGSIVINTDQTKSTKLTTKQGTYHVLFSTPNQIKVGGTNVSKISFNALTPVVTDIFFRSKYIFLKPNMSLVVGLSNVELYNASVVTSLAAQETVFIQRSCFNIFANENVDRVIISYLTSEVKFKQSQENLLEVYQNKALVLQYRIKVSGNKITTINGTYNLSLGPPAGTFSSSMFLDSTIIDSLSPNGTSITATPSDTSLIATNIYLNCGEVIQINTSHLVIFGKNDISCLNDNTVYIGNLAYNTVIDQYVKIVKITERLFDLVFRKSGNQLIVHKKNDTNVNPLISWTQTVTASKLQFLDGELDVVLSGSNIVLGGQNVVTTAVPAIVSPLVPFGSNKSNIVYLNDNQIFKASVSNLIIFGLNNNETVVINKNALNIRCSRVLNIHIQYSLKDLIFLQQGIELLIYTKSYNKLVCSIPIEFKSSYLTTYEGSYEIKLLVVGNNFRQITLAGDPVHPSVPGAIQGRQRLNNVGSNIIELDLADRYITDKSDLKINGYTDGSGSLQILKNVTNIIVPVRTRQVLFEYEFKELKFKQTGVQLLVYSDTLIATINMVGDSAVKITTLTGTALAALNPGTLVISLGGVAVNSTSPSSLIPISFSKAEISKIPLNSISSDGQGGLFNGGNGRIVITGPNSDSIFSYRIDSGRKRFITMYNGFKTMIARLRQNSFNGSILANSQIVSVHGQGLSSLSPSDFNNSKVTFNANTVNYQGFITSNLSLISSRLTSLKTHTKQFIVKLRLGSFSGPVVATSQIVDILNLGNSKFNKFDLQDGKTSFEVVTGTDSKSTVTKIISNIGYVRMTTTSTTSTSTTSTSTSTSTSTTSTTSTSTSTTSTSTSTTTLGPTTSTSTSTSTTTIKPSSTSTSTTSTSSTSTTTLPKTTSTTTNLFYNITPQLNGRNCFVVGDIMVFDVQSVFANKTFFIETSGTAKSSPMSAGPLTTDSIETSPGSGKYRAFFNLEATNIGILNVYLIPADTGIVSCAITVCIIRTTSTSTSTSTTSTTTTTAAPIFGQHTSTTSTSTTTSAAPYSGQTTSSTTLAFPL